MPLVTLHLVALAAGSSIPEFLELLGSKSVQPLVVSRAIRWIIKPESLSVSPLLETSWDLLIILPVDVPLPKLCLSEDKTKAVWTITAGVPSSLIKDFGTRNKRLLHPESGDVPPLTGSLNRPRKADSAQRLELNEDLLRWSEGFELGRGAVSMLNLLAFKPGKEAHASYLKYGKAFAESIGSRRGGTAKIVGKVVPGKGTPGEDDAGWDEIALAHYPSIQHFTDMLASEDYQEVNHRNRLPALRDTCILCTSELDPALKTTVKAKL